MFFKTVFFGDRRKKIFEDVFFSENNWVCVLGAWPWPRIFFVSLALTSSLVSSTPPLTNTKKKSTKIRTYNTNDQEKAYT